MLSTGAAIEQPTFGAHTVKRALNSLGPSTLSDFWLSIEAGGQWWPFLVNSPPREVIIYHDAPMNCGSVLERSKRDICSLRLTPSGYGHVPLFVRLFLFVRGHIILCCNSSEAANSHHMLIQYGDQTQKQLNSAFVSQLCDIQLQFSLFSVTLSAIA